MQGCDEAGGEDFKKKEPKKKEYKNGTEFRKAAYEANKNGDLQSFIKNTKWSEVYDEDFGTVYIINDENGRNAYSLTVSKRGDAPMLDVGWSSYKIDDPSGFEGVDYNKYVREKNAKK